MSFFAKNMETLNARDPAMALWVESAPSHEQIEITISKSGHPTPKIDGAPLHSGYHPEKEGATFARELDGGPGDTIVIFGFGFGYHIEQVALCGARVVVVEPCAGVVKAAFENRDLSSVISKAELISPARFESIAEDFDYAKAAWADHAPTARLYRKERDRLAEPFMARSAATRMKYKVMVVGPTYGGTTTTAVSVVRALKALGFSVEFVDNTVHAEEFLGIKNITPNPEHTKALQSIYTNYLGETVVARADYAHPDMIIALAQAPLTPDVIERLKQIGAPVIFWFVENYRTIQYWQTVAASYDYFFCMQKGDFLDAVQGAGAPFAAYLPQAADHFVHRPVELYPGEKEKYGSPVSFMGAGYPNRRKFFSAFLDFPLKIWGTEWNLSTALGQTVANANRRLSPEEYVKIFNASDINLNLHSSLTGSGLETVGDFVNPRTFEIAACGGFQLVDQRQSLGEMFEIGKEIVTFSDTDDLREKISYYITRPDERKAIATAGRRRVLREHTFVHRMAKMMNSVLARDAGKIERARSQRKGINDIDSMIERTSKPELARFLEQFKGQEALSLKKVMDAIAEGEGDLTRPEAIFIMVEKILTQGAGR